MESTSNIIVGLVRALKKYLGLQKRYIQLDLTEKLTLLLTALILGTIFFVLGMIVVIFLALALSAFLAQALGSVVWAHLIIAGGFVCICVLLYFMRNPWIVNPLSQFFAGLLMDNINEDENESEY